MVNCVAYLNYKLETKKDKILYTWNGRNSNFDYFDNWIFRANFHNAITN